jgi:hypothetical protein
MNILNSNRCMGIRGSMRSWLTRKSSPPQRRNQIECWDLFLGVFVWRPNDNPFPVLIVLEYYGGLLLFDVSVDPPEIKCGNENSLDRLRFDSLFGFVVSADAYASGGASLDDFVVN